MYLRWDGEIARFTSLYQHITIVFFVLLFYLFLYNIFRQRQLFILFQFSPSFRNFLLKWEEWKKKTFIFKQPQCHASYQNFLIFFLFSNKQKCSLKNWMYCFCRIMMKIYWSSMNFWLEREILSLILGLITSYVR